MTIPLYKSMRAGLYVLIVASAFFSAFFAVPWSVRAESRATPLLVVASTAMISQPASRLFGDTAHVVTLMKEGTDPHLYRPTRADMVALARADVVLWTGADLEANLRRPIDSLVAERQLVLTLMDFVPPAQRLSVRGSSADPHIWMDPLLWRSVFAQAVSVLEERFPKQAANYRQRWQDIADDWQNLHTAIETMTSSLPASQRVLITAHDAFSYFGRRYNIGVEGIQGISTESEAGLRRMRSLIDMIIAKRIPAIFSEASVSPRHVLSLLEGVQARGIALQLGGVLYGDSMGHPHSIEGTYEGMMRHNAATIVRALSKPAQDVAAHSDSRVRSPSDSHP
ncbi:MAG: zinc ABC transporter substrate-binding protein [Alphaproteobacteria bacterium GM202ARS2]|nr:zinc ABC transporter substrate-binding protein [Alphaproteobacteria bacterium GM202ARS2]